MLADLHQIFAGDDPDHKKPPTPQNTRLEHTWTIDLYVYVASITQSILILTYLLTFYKAWKGTRYCFILLLVGLLLLGAIGSLGAAISMHSASMQRPKGSDLVLDATITKVAYYMDISYVFSAIRDLSFSISIWCFAFRYWNISFVMLVRLKGEEVTTRFKLISISIFFVVLFLNVLIPSLRTKYAFDMNTGHNIRTQLANWNEYRTEFYICTYSLAIVQGISAIFILWAIIRLFVASGRSLTIQELVKQKFITLHFVTLLVYLTSLTTYYVYFSTWDTNDSLAENQVFIAWTVCIVLMLFVQMSLIFLFISLSKPDEVYQQQTNPALSNRIPAQQKNLDTSSSSIAAIKVISVDSVSGYASNSKLKQHASMREGSQPSLRGGSFSSASNSDESAVAPPSRPTYLTVGSDTLVDDSMEHDHSQDCTTVNAMMKRSTLNMKERDKQKEINRQSVQSGAHFGSLSAFTGFGAGAGGQLDHRIFRNLYPGAAYQNSDGDSWAGGTIMSTGGAREYSIMNDMSNNQIPRQLELSTNEDEIKESLLLQTVQPADSGQVMRRQRELSNDQLGLEATERNTMPSNLAFSSLHRNSVLGNSSRGPDHSLEIHAMNVNDQRKMSAVGPEQVSKSDVHTSIAISQPLNSSAENSRSSFTV